MKKFVFFLLALGSLSSAVAQGISAAQQRKLSYALNMVSNLYVDTINDKKLVENTIESVLKELDPHSAYIAKEDLPRVNEPLEGSFEGIGVQFQILDDSIVVEQAISGCPAEKVGVLPGDRIVYIDGKLVAGVKIQISQVPKLLRGRKGTEVSIKVHRRGTPGLMEFKIIRDKIPLYSVDASYMIGKDIGYIKINSFGSETVEEFRKALDGLQKQGMKSLVLSLQGNGGGYLKSAIGIADEFLSRDKLIVYTQGLNQPKSVSESTGLGGFEKGKLVVLIDEFSASASEIVTGALQDWDRAVVVGRRSFGKGLVQGQFSLPDGSMMRLTVARYYTPSGRCIQKSYKNGYDKYEMDLNDRYKHGEFLHADSIHLADSLKYHTLTLKRTVYGGGGIMPDVFVPMDTTQYTMAYRKLVGMGIINKVISQYVDKNRAELKDKYPAFDKFRTGYETDKTLLTQLLTTAEKDKVTINSKEFETSTPLILLQLKALVARDLWGVSEYFQIANAENESLQKAVEILQTRGAYEKILSPAHIK